MPRVAKTPLTRTEHDTIGLLLATMSDQMANITVRVSGAMPRTGSNPRATAYKALNRVVDALATARSALEEELFRAHSDAETSVYYPHPDTRTVTLPVPLGRIDRSGL